MPGAEPKEIVVGGVRSVKRSGLFWAGHDGSRGKLWGCFGENLVRNHLWYMSPEITLYVPGHWQICTSVVEKEDV